MKATQYVLEATGIPIGWEHIKIADEAMAEPGRPLPLDTVRRLRAVDRSIKAPLIVNKLQGRICCIQGDGALETYPSLNNAIRRELGVLSTHGDQRLFARL
ncbi:hypothetical protein B0T10DRAFT_458180 [Thelonectria olida]|uniref:Uncharacterized protein n=1 Tax=Thelonectria olida TaxID=1576542 RepID=A0A9P9ASA3_9HYPO|nr:hypothetical protein B0T10DRAFT_458180 [Thelonectria olida]